MAQLGVALDARLQPGDRFGHARERLSHGEQAHNSTAALGC
jgi:hypothetical protein